MKTQDLIQNLANDAGVTKSQKPAVLFSKWLAFSVVYLVAMVALFGMRSDINIQLQKPLFLAEIISLLLVALSVGISSIIISYPDNYQRKNIAFVPLIPIAMFITVLAVQIKESVHLTENLDGVAGCFICICIFAIGPGVYLFRKLKSNATTSPRLAGAMGMLAAFCFGALAIRFTEKVDSMEHIILAHYLPLIVLSFAGMLAGRKLLKW